MYEMFLNRQKVKGVRIGKLRLPIVSVHELDPLCTPRGQGAQDAFERELGMIEREDEFDDQ